MNMTPDYIVQLLHAERSARLREEAAAHSRVDAAPRARRRLRRRARRLAAPVVPLQRPPERRPSGDREAA